MRTAAGAEHGAATGDDVMDGGVQWYQQVGQWEHFKEKCMASLKTTNSGGEFEKAPEGMHIARCFKIVDLGTHMNPTYGKEQRLAWVFFELPNTLMSKGESAGKPFVIGKRYGLSHNDKSYLRVDLESWYGKKFDTKALDDAGGFDLAKLIGRPALVNIVHSEDGKYANIKAITPLVQGMECPAQVNESFIFSLSEFDPAAFSRLSDKMQEFIKQSNEYRELQEPRSPMTAIAGMDDDIPF
jgi:hypothetical protein